MIVCMNLKQLAKHLNLSQTTVSRALNGYPEVNAETRRRVDEVARKVGYRPNPHAMRLATGRSHAIGHVLPSDRALLIDPHFSDFIAGAGDVYSANGFDVMLHVGGSEDEQTVYRRYAQSGAVDGVVVMGPRLNDWRIAYSRNWNCLSLCMGGPATARKVMRGLISTIAAHSGRPQNC